MADEAAISQVVESLGLIWERYGANRTMGRMLGWLLVCDPPEQTAAQLAAALQVSKASVSTATRQLESAGLAERVTVPGERQLRYRLRDVGWESTVTMRVREMRALSDLGALAQRALADEPPERRTRAARFETFNRWWLERYERLIEEWQKERA